MPQQNEIDVVLTAEQLAQLDTAIATLESIASAFPLLSAADKAGLVKPPDGADGWMTSMLIRAEQNLERLPRDFDPAGVQRDLALDAAIAPRELRLSRVLDRFGNGRFLARSDAFAVLLGARRTLRDSGVSGVDDDLSEGLQRFFRRSGVGNGGQGAPTPVAAPAAK